MSVVLFSRSLQLAVSELAVPVGDGGADLVGGVFLEEVVAGDGELLLLVGPVRQNSRWGPVRMAPGSALMNSLGSGLVVSQVP